jgi:type IV secretory pathway TraG/TraD family ATPase VirD4
MKTYIGRGHRLVQRDKEIDIAINDADLSGHFWCFGTTRVGKTRMIENIVEQSINKGYSVVIIDPKGDVELFSKITQVALEAKREDDLMLLSPIFPQYSIQLNPLEHYYMIEELVGHLIAGIEVGKEPFFFNVAYETSLMIVQAFMVLTKKEYGERFNFNDVKDVVSHHDLETLQKKVETIAVDDSTRQLATDLKKIVDSGQDYYNKVSSSLRVALMELTSGNIGQVIGHARGNPVIDRLESGKGVILVAQVGSLITRKAAFTVGKVLISMLQAYTGRIFSSGRKVQPTLQIIMDEAQNVLYKGIDDFFAKAGGANVQLFGFCQSVNQIYAMLDRSFGNSILDNTNNKGFMRVPDSETAEYVCRHFGVEKQMTSMMSTSGVLNIRETEADVLKVEDVLNLGRREFFMLNYDGAYFGKTNAVSDLYIDVIYPRAEV